MSKNFDEDIKRITNELIEDGTVDKILREKITKGFEEVIESAFRWGDLNRAIEKRIKEVMIPAVEQYDMSEYIVKIDSMLSDVVKNTKLADNKRILENFSELMMEPDSDTITLPEMFEAYKKFVSKSMNTDGRDVEFDDGPHYRSMGVLVNLIHEERRSWSSMDYIDLEFIIDEDEESEEEQENLNVHLKLSRFRDSKYNKGFRISYDCDTSIQGLRRISDFEVFLLRLSRAGIQLIPDDKKWTDIDSDCGMDDYVQSVNEPEPDYS